MILIIDTSSSNIRLAFGDKTLVAESARQSADLPRLVAELAGDEKPEAVGIVAGPGSFTGIRLGIAFAKGLAMGWGVPIVGINVFELAGTGRLAGVLAIDSGRGDYFVFDGEKYRIEKEPPAGARLIFDYDIADGIGIVSEKLRAGLPPPVIPLYIRPSYVG
jgi:tRNA A37 threonylcarbamoyladenosine modification protein TsaB